MEYWIVYDLASGAELWRGSCPAGASAFQQLPEGAALVVVPQAVIARPVLDLDVLRAAMALRIDAEAEQVRRRYRTPGTGQDAMYASKEAEARSFMANKKGKMGPFLSVEGKARGMSDAVLAAEVITRADAWTVLGPEIEGVRMGAKARIAAADTLGGIVAAAALDWSGLALIEAELKANAPAS